MDPDNPRLPSHSFSSGNSGKAESRKMFKRLFWSGISKVKVEEDTSDVDSSQDESSRKRQKREHSASELSSPASLTHFDRFQQRDSRRYSRKKRKANHQRRRQNRNRNRTPYQHQSNLPYSYTDCEAESEDCGLSSTDEEDYRHDRNTSRWRKYKAHQPSSESDGEEVKVLGTWKRQNAVFYDRKKPEQNWGQRMDNAIVIESESESESNSESSQRMDNVIVIESESESESKSESSPSSNRATGGKVQKAPKPIIPWSAEAIGRTVQAKDSVRRKKRIARIGTVVAWKDKDTVSVKWGQNSFSHTMKLTEIDLLPEEEEVVEAKPRAKALRTRSKLTKGQHQKTLPKTKPVPGSKEARKPALQPKQKPKQQQQSRSSAPLPTSDHSKSINNNSSKSGEAKRGRGCNVFHVEEADGEKWGSKSQREAAKPKETIVNDGSNSAEAVRKKGCKVLSMEVSDQAAVEELRTKSLGGVAKPRDEIMSISSEDEVWDQTFPANTVSPTIGPWRSESISNDDCLRAGTNGLFYDSDSDLDDIKMLDAIECISSCAQVAKISSTTVSGSFAVGQRVRVSENYGKSYKRGKAGTIVGEKARKGHARTTIFEVQFDHNGRRYHFRDSSLVALDGSTPKRLGTLKQPGSKTTKSATPRKKNANKMPSKPRKKGIAPAPSAEAREWIVPQTIVPENRFMGLQNAKIVLPGDPKDESCFLKHMLKDQRLTLEVPLKKDLPVDKAIKEELKDDFGNVIYKMMSAKVFEENNNYPGQLWTRKNSYARVVYAAVGKTAEGQIFSINDQLLRIADFTTLNPRKIAARLELFQSPTNLRITEHEESVFQEIDDAGYVGGGFIHEDFLEELLVAAGMGPTAASRASAIQVRIFIPSRGIFKGMLMKKRTRNGAPIELPSSMKKVMGSTHPRRFKRAHILINKAKVHPSKGNQMIGKKLDPDDEPSEKSFKFYIKKPLTNIIRRLWETLGVPPDLCERYITESLEPDRRNHAWLVGVPDPTGSLPPDTIFVPGLGLGLKEPHDIFVTRLPCYAREHGRKFRAITRKPHGMSSEDWDWLNNKEHVSFGVIIFSNPRPGMLSIPERIASGDLDGDLYLVCWDKEVVDSMTRVLPLVDEPAEDDGKLSTVPYDPEWYSKAQKIHIEKLRTEYGQLIGSLYRLAEKISDLEDEKLDHPDVRALYNAYNEALEYTKHGRPIRLPRHLIAKLKKNLHPFVEPID